MKTTAKHLAAQAFFAVLALSPAAMAQDAARPGEPLTVRINYADLNVETEAGMQTLGERVDGAVRRVCPISFRGTRMNEVGQCRQYARRDAWRQFEHNQERARAGRNLETAGIAARRPAL